MRTLRASCPGEHGAVTVETGGSPKGSTGCAQLGSCMIMLGHVRKKHVPLFQTICHMFCHGKWVGALYTTVNSFTSGDPHHVSRHGGEHAAMVKGFVVLGWLLMLGSLRQGVARVYTWHSAPSVALWPPATQNPTHTGKHIFVLCCVVLRCVFFFWWW